MFAPRTNPRYAGFLFTLVNTKKNNTSKGAIFLAQREGYWLRQSVVAQQLFVRDNRFVVRSSHEPPICGVSFYPRQYQKNNTSKGAIFLAQREGFEPPETRISTVFKTAAIDHSAISAYIFCATRKNNYYYSG